MPAHPSLRVNRIAVATTFFVHGMVGGDWASRVPWVQDRMHLSPGVLGLALLTPAIGSVVALPLSGRLASRHGSRAATRVGLLGMCCTLALLTAIPRLPWLVAVLLVFGAAGAVTDVGMNANAVAVEGRLGRPVMSGLHAMWSMGALAGGAVGAIAAHAGVAAPIHLACAGGALAITGAAANSRLLAVPGTDTAEATKLRRPSHAVVLIGLLAAAGMFAEGAANEWSAVYAHRVDGADPGTAAMAFTTFALAMVVGRLAGDSLVRRLGAVRLLRLTGAVAACGAAVVAGVPVLPATLAGFGLLGLGLSVAVPLCFGAAGHAGGERSGHAIAAVATVGYAGWLAAPAAVGGIAQVGSLPMSFAAVAAVAALIVPLAAAARSHAGQPAEPGGDELDTAAAGHRSAEPPLSRP